jgi:hypothetical protein
MCLAQTTFSQFVPSFIHLFFFFATNSVAVQVRQESQPPGMPPSEKLAPAVHGEHTVFWPRPSQWVETYLEAKETKKTIKRKKLENLTKFFLPPL